MPNSQKALDANGVLYFWQKIKTIFAMKTELPGTVSKQASGLVPQLPDEVNTTKYFRQDGTWAVPDGQSEANFTAAEKAKLAEFGAASTYALKSEIVGVYRYKGSVATASLLPSSGQAVGDVYSIEAASSYGGPNMNVAWAGSAWDPLGEIFTITPITNAEIDAIVAT